jgi:hypothetical protein
MKFHPKYQLRFFCCTSHFSPSNGRRPKVLFGGPGNSTDISWLFLCEPVFQRAEKGASRRLKRRRRRQLQQCNVSIPLYKMVYTPSSTPTNLCSTPLTNYPKLPTPSHIYLLILGPRLPPQSNITPPRSIEKATTTDTNKHKGEIASNLMVWYL